MDDESTQVTLTYTLSLPRDESKMKLLLNSPILASTILEIQKKCRSVWKYEQDPSQDRLSLAEEIFRIINDNIASNEI